MTTRKGSPTEDLLLKKIKDIQEEQKSQADRHKFMHRSLWAASALVSLSIAVFSTFDFDISQTIDSRVLATFLSLVLPLITGYVVFRAPEKLWIYEVDTRNQLSDLATEIELIIDRDGSYDRAEYEKKFLDLLDKINKRWLELNKMTG